MNKISIIFLALLIMLAGKSFAQPITVQSIGLSKPFIFDLYFGNEGKGACV